VVTDPVDVVVVASVKKRANTPESRAPDYLREFKNRGPLFYKGDMNYLPNPIMP